MLYAIELLPYHLAKANQVSKIYQLLTNIEFLELKTELFSVFDLIEDFLLIKILQLEKTKKEILVLIEEVIRRNIHFLHLHPQSLFQCLWNYCWWYDSPALSDFIDYKKIHTTFNKNYLTKIKQKNLHLLPERWLEQKKMNNEDFYWLRTLTPPITPLGGNLEQSFSGHTDSILSIDVNLESGLLVSGSSDKTVRIWDISSGQLYGCIQMDKWVMDVKFSPCGKFVAIGFDSVGMFYDTAIQIWNIQKNNLEKSINGHFGRILSLAYSPCGKYIVSGSADYTVRIWEIKSGNQVLCFDNNEAPIRTVDWSKDGKKIISGALISDIFKEGVIKKSIKY